MKILLLLCLCFCTTACSLITPNAYGEKPLFSMRADEVWEDRDVAALAKAAGRNRRGAIDDLLEAGVDIDARGRGDFTPLYWAFRQTNRRGFEYLLQKGANPNALWEHKGSVIHYAATVRDTRFLELCLEYGGDISLIDKNGPLSNWTPLYFAIGENQLSSVRFLIRAGAKVNERYGGEGTPLTESLQFKQYRMAYFLLENGADPSVRDMHDRDVYYYLNVPGFENIIKSSDRWEWRLKFIELLESKMQQADRARTQPTSVNSGDSQDL
ncbi:MAG: ankyrin repeat domain-containing protein [Pseudomonadota bacterium]